ncbi:voltage-dependent anion channel [Hyaloscypha sp. PMI_1271]|nr:voltage-dependent anion channel [Hyaloscypha sp. PMI_1271]
MVYPQISKPMNYQYADKERERFGREIREETIKIQSISIDHEKEEAVIGSVSLRDRLKHFTFAWYAMTMSTGGVAFVLSVIPNRFDGLTGLGTAIFILNLFLFTCVTITICSRFILHPGTLKHSLTNPHEGFFFATFWLSLATMITNTTTYGIPNTGPWIITALRLAFWVYTICATLLAIFYYHVLFTVKKLVLTNALPGWVLPIFPAMLVGTLASAIAKIQPAEHALPILVAGLSYQGLGMMVAIMMYGLYFGRLLTSGLPLDMSRPAMFIAVGPPSFTALAFIGMAQDVATTKIFSTYPLIPDLLQILALIAAISLWVLAFWFFSIALVATIEAVGRNDFHMNWYAYVFPNVGFTIATIKIGERLDSRAIQGVGSGMGAVLFFLLVLIYGCHVRAVLQRKICWPGKDEDAH